MKKVLSLLCLLLIVGCGFNNYWEVTDDSINFKNENEVLNNQISSNGTEYLKLKLSKSNPIKYLTYDEVIEFLKNETGILYFGRPGCPYCRSTIDTMFEFASENKIKTIYYYNPETIRSENSLEYKKLLEILDEYLSVDLVTQKEEDENFDSNLKRLIVPNLFFVVNGEIIGNYNESRSEYRNEITDEQKKDLKQKYNDIYKDYLISLSQCTLDC